MTEFLASNEHPYADALGLWWVPENGYHWFQAGGQEGDDKPWYLMPNATRELAGRPAVKERAYALFRSKKLVRDFDMLAARVVKLFDAGNLGTIQELIKAFADEHGWLGVAGNQGLDVIAEPLSNWLAHLCEWNDLRTTWKAITTIRATQGAGRRDKHEQQHKGRETLEQRVEWSEDGTEIRYNKLTAVPVVGERVLIASAKHPDMVNTGHLPERFNKPDSVSDPGLIEPAEYYVTDEVNKVVSATVVYGLLHFEKKARLYPTSLVGGLYFQFLTELEGTLARPRRCTFKGCKQIYFTPKRRDQKFCDSRCRAAQWDRDTQAIKKESMHAQTIKR